MTQVTLNGNPRSKVELPKSIVLKVHSPFFSTLVLFKHQLFLLGFWFSGKKDPGKNGEV